MPDVELPAVGVQAFAVVPPCQANSESHGPVLGAERQRVRELDGHGAGARADAEALTGESAEGAATCAEGKLCVARGEAARRCLKAGVYEPHAELRWIPVVESVGWGRTRGVIRALVRSREHEQLTRT